MIALAARSPLGDPGRPDSPVTVRRRTAETEACGGAPVLDLALCLILAVTVVGLLLLAL